MAARSSFSRIERVLDYIHQNIDKPLSLEDIADYSCCSRWQLQRVFQQQTGLNVAQYVRELKLSIAADKVLLGQERMLDIAYELGFNSEVSFSRSFKQLFQLSPREYQRRGLRVGMRNPIAAAPDINAVQLLDTGFLQTRIEHRPAFIVYGISSPIKGVLSDTPDFSQIVPATWKTLMELIGQLVPVEGKMVGVVDTLSQLNDLQSINYWAAVEVESTVVTALLANKQLQKLIIPAQDYAVVSYSGKLEGFSQLVEWLICDWLPISGYVSVDGYELESYGEITMEFDSSTEMEYWLPIKRRL
ncbi:AraC family transcriptional regulator [Shewanella fidelis]|uniref:AraC family transcriptional regulator n=1 Tax=Shewanella fidelis TaxID=173509 RepID=A0AAW8NV65_9GAMM|nr:AraC family transcriptional regulator [Shewanella fidelis]MDR8526106.1 AraC family transcriptional regulator [Shewanella fidelis]MDW4813719.1 AraC family transcriptional regulator [Shewanella fidelis]MDW4817815.1 AraC family transcriptional regulator [Shewanella fidelis]MDW4821924.1 AraC family transcriptional regulator [Shewanella fidelis]MDW4826047.1 AraC family transcriptional regulator [Shewanella fidelis]